MSPPAPAASRMPRLLVALATPLAIFASLRVVSVELSYPWTVLEAGALWVLSPAWLLLAVALVGRHLRVAGAIGLVALVHVAWAFDFLPRRLGGGIEGGGATLRLVSANLLAPAPSVELARALRSHDADVMVMTELSTEWLPVLETEATLASLPEHAFDPRPAVETYFGIGIASRFPITSEERVDLGTPAIRVELDVRGSTVRVWAVHPFPPSSPRGVARHRASLAAVRARLVRERDDGVPTIVAGDLNTTPQTRMFRELLADAGLVAAHDLGGNPFACTWPMRGWGIPPVFRLDHVLVRGLAVRAVASADAVTSDHAPLVVDLELPR